MINIVNGTVKWIFLLMVILEVRKNRSCVVSKEWPRYLRFSEMRTTLEHVASVCNGCYSIRSLSVHVQYM